MARAARHRIELSEGERVELVRVARAEKRPWQEVQRARIVLYAAEGLHDTEIAARLDTSAGMGVRRWSSFEYRRGGTLAYLAAWDVHHANLFDRVEAKTGIEPFGRLVEHVMTTEPYASARRVFWIVDNGSSHAGRTSIARMPDAWPNARLIHLPIHAS
jgi:hypothetical protein